LPQSRNPSPDLPADIEAISDRDLFGQLSLKAWSCLVLDTADNIVKYAGKPGYELYYRIAQQIEAGFTAFEGAGEAEIRRIFYENYVAWSLDYFFQIYPQIEIPSV
jgi:hypothetical protein